MELMVMDKLKDMHISRSKDYLDTSVCHIPDPRNIYKGLNTKNYREEQYTPRVSVLIMKLSMTPGTC